MHLFYNFSILIFFYLFKFIFFFIIIVHFIISVLWLLLLIFLLFSWFWMICYSLRLCLINISYSLIFWFINNQELLELNELLLNNRRDWLIYFLIILIIHVNPLFLFFIYIAFFFLTTLYHLFLNLILAFFLSFINFTNIEPLYLFIIKSIDFIKFVIITKLNIFIIILNETSETLNRSLQAYTLLRKTNKNINHSMITLL